MSEDLIVEHCSPTLAGLKTGNMFSCKIEKGKVDLEDFKRINRQLVPCGLCMIPLRVENGRMLVYIYRPDQLAKDLNQTLAKKILTERHYQMKSTNSCVAELIQRFKNTGEFPHEIGLFLGYPPEDVEGFINGSQNAKLVGSWKVYGDVESARAKFRAFKHCTKALSENYRNYRSLERIIVKCA